VLFIHYRNRVLCRVSKTLGKGYFTLGKDFMGKGFFAEYFFRALYRVSKNTRQIKNRKNLKKQQNIFFKILGITLQLYLLPYPLPR
jgi:DNA modification methylase